MYTLKELQLQLPFEERQEYNLKKAQEELTEYNRAEVIAAAKQAVKEQLKLRTYDNGNGNLSNRRSRKN